METLPERLEVSGVRGWLHLPAGPPRASIAIAHGAGSDCETPLIVSVARVFAAAGCLALRYDMHFRQNRKAPTGEAQQQRDRDSIRQGIDELRHRAPQVPLYLAGHSYGGRQSSVLLSEDPSVAEALLLLSYPLHPPGKPEKLRTEHFPSLRTPTLFVHGTRDEFGSVAELELAVKSIPARTRIQIMDRAGHGLPLIAASSLPQWLDIFLT